MTVTMRQYAGFIVEIAVFWENNAGVAATWLANRFGQLKFPEAFVPFTIAVKMKNNWNTAAYAKNFLAQCFLI